MSRRRSASRRKKSSGLRIKLFFTLILLVVLGWAGMTAYHAYFQIKPLQQPPSHTFITQDANTPVLAIVKQSTQASQLDALVILKADLEKRKLTVLQLPLELSDGQTTIGQYVESRYYKEMQLAIEQQLALPLTGYVIQTRVSQDSATKSIIDNLTLQAPTDWWTTTVGLPLWLDQISEFHTSLDYWKLLQILWLIRDLNQSSDQVIQTPDLALQQSGSKLQLLPGQIDPVIQQEFVDTEIESEGLSIVVKNATDVSGLAALASRFVSNMGGVVVAVEPADTSQTNSSITTDHESKLASSISNFLGIPPTIQEKTGRERADIEFIIGADALVRLGK